jgi:hypothetical protein
MAFRISRAVAKPQFRSPISIKIPLILVSVFAFSIPYKIGMKNLNSTNYPSRYIFQLEYNQKQIEALARSRTLNNPENFANKVQDIINELNSLIPFTVKIGREIDLDKEKLTIEDVIDATGDSKASNLFNLKLITLPNENGYLFDTAEFTLSINNSRG